MGSVAYWCVLILLNAGMLVFNLTHQQNQFMLYLACSINVMGFILCIMGLISRLARRDSR